MRRQRLVVVALLALAGVYLLAGAIGPATETPPEEAVRTVDDDELIQPGGSESRLWPYTSSSRSVRDRTLAINLVVYGPPERTREALTTRGELEWTETNDTLAEADAEQYNVSAEDGFGWNDAAGSTRYTYIDAGGEAGWVDESYQLHTGSYFGSRYHIRAYGADEWTAIQAHEEYFDWFRLRHTVTSADDAGEVVEREFIGQPFVGSVSRTHYGLEGGWSDGWISEIHLAVGLVALTLLGRDGRLALRAGGRALGRWAHRNRSGFVLAAGLAGVVLGVRLLGIALEGPFAGRPHLLTGALYPVLVVGPPLLVAKLAPRLRANAAFGFTLVGMAFGFVYDAAAIGLGVVPLDLVVHRVGLVTALGLFAVAVVSTGERATDGDRRVGDDTSSRDGVGDDTDRRGGDASGTPRRGGSDRPGAAHPSVEDLPLPLLAAGTWLFGLALPLFGYL